jgi:hypothetical protein
MWVVRLTVRVALKTDGTFKLVTQILGTQHRKRDRTSLRVNTAFRKAMQKHKARIGQK